MLWYTRLPSNAAWNVQTHEQHQMHTMPAVIDRKMHSMVRALGRSDAKPRAIGCATTRVCNHQNKLINFSTNIPSNQHFKAIPMPKLNSETSFHSQFFKGNSNIIFLKPCKASFRSIFYLSFFLSFFLYLSIYLSPYKLDSFNNVACQWWYLILSFKYC